MFVVPGTVVPRCFVLFYQRQNFATQRLTLMKSDNRCEFIRDRSFTTDAGL